MRNSAMLSAFIVLFVSTCFADDKVQKHEQMVYPVVRVLSGDSGGSGTVLYSEDRSDKNDFETFILTNFHVIENSVVVVSEWSSLLGREVKIEKRKTVKVEVFRYEGLSIVAGRESFDADIKAHSRAHDLAILQLRTKEPIKYVAKIKPKSEARDVYLFDNVVVVGCSLLHAPLITSGEITSLNDEIDDMTYWMSNAQIIFGNSGGAIYGKSKDGDWEFIGVPSRISVTASSPIPHMGYFVPTPRLYEWLESEKLDFMFDKTKTPKECFEIRKQMIKQSMEKAELEIKKSMKQSYNNPPGPEEPPQPPQPPGPKP